MSAIVVGFMEVLSWVHSDIALIQNQDATRDHYDAAWTLNILIGVITAALIFTVAPLAGIFFAEPRVVPVIQFLALRPLVSGFENIGIVAFRKEFQFAKEFRFFVVGRLLTFVVTVSIAWLYRNYWALAIGMVTGPTLQLVLSYVMHRYRPRISARKLGEIWRFSRWMLFFRLGEFLSNRTDELVIANVSSMGNYSVAASISLMLTSEIVLPLERSLLPGFAKLAHDARELGAAFLKAVGAVAIVCCALGAGLATVADDLVAVVLGPKWMASVPFVRWLAIFGAFSGIAYIVRILLIASGREKDNAFRNNF